MKRAFVLMTVLLIAAGSPVALHLALSKAEPGVDATVTAAPRSINLFFTQAPQIRATTVQLKAVDGAAVELAQPRADESDGKVVRSAVTGRVAPGQYEVAWRALARDGHVVSGSYRFTYRPAAEGATN